MLLLSITVFLAFLAIVLVIFKLDSAQSSAYIVQYRASLGISALKTGQAGELIAFIAFAIMVAVVNILVSIRVYLIKREVSVVVLLMGVLLLLSSVIVSNALLSLR